MTTQRKVALITGAADGVGWGLSQAFLNEGYDLFLVDRNGSQLSERQALLLQQSSNTSQRVETLALDLLASDAVEKLSTVFHECFSALNVLINNAGITHRSLAAQTHIDVTKRVMELDFLVPVALTQSLLPSLTKGGNPSEPATIINLCSMAGWMPVLGRSGYCAAKSALHQYFETFRAENHDNDIHVLMVYPSFLNTRIEQNALGGNGQTANHARTTTGAVHSVDWLVPKIMTALQKKKPRLFPNRPIAMASLLYRLLPSVFLTLMQRKFSAELQSSTASK